MSFRVAVAGCTGYAGDEALRLLSQYPGVGTGALASSSSAGDRLRGHRPRLAPLADRGIVTTTAENLADHDVVFPALPRGAGAGVTRQFGAETLVIDAGTDFRLHDSEQWWRFYSSEYTRIWPYGLPELPGCRGILRSVGWITVPGCYLTAVTLALFSVIQAGLIDPAGTVVVAVPGTPGAGKAAKPRFLGSEIMGSASIHEVGGMHRYTPGITQNLSAVTDERVDVSFIPIPVSIPRGILATCTASRAGDVAANKVWRCYEVTYADEPSVDLLPEGAWSATMEVLSSNQVTIQVAVDEAAGRVTVVPAIDNLTKGTAGGVVQSMNTALGLDETIGLSTIGVAL